MRGGDRTVGSMTTAESHAGPAVQRPLEHVTAVFAAIREWEATYPHLAPCGQTEAILWALGKREQAPVSGRIAAGPVPTLGEVQAEIRTAEEMPRRGKTIPADGVLAALRWLTGIRDGLPIPGFEPPSGWGHLVGGRGVILRTEADIQQVADRARAGRPSASSEWEETWCSGVLATCEWVLGTRSTSPVRELPRPAEGPSGRDLGRERAVAEDVSRQLGEGKQHSPGYGDGIMRTVIWLRGETTVPPVNEFGRSTPLSR